MTLSDIAHQTIQALGDTWSLRLLRECFRGARRFSDFSRRLGISKAVLTARLENFVAWGVLCRSAEAGRHPTYRLTDRGLDLWSLMLAMWLWESEWDAGPEGPKGIDRPRVRLVHLGCGHVMHPRLCCATCDGAVRMADTVWPTPAAVDSAASEAAIPAAHASFRRAPRSLQDIQDDNAAGRLPRVIGDRWNSALVLASLNGASKFSEFERALAVPPSLLAGRLRELIEMDLLRPTRADDRRGGYALTAAGRALHPIILEILRWGTTWLGSPRADEEIQHRPCGAPLRVRWHCGHCAQALTRVALRFDGATPSTGAEAPSPGRAAAKDPHKAAASPSTGRSRRRIGRLPV